MHNEINSVHCGMQYVILYCSLQIHMSVDKGSCLSYRGPLGSVGLSLKPVITWSCKTNDTKSV